MAHVQATAWQPLRPQPGGPAGFGRAGGRIHGVVREQARQYAANGPAGPTLGQIRLLSARNRQTKERLALDPYMIQKHLAGERTIGLYAMIPETQCSKWVPIDAELKPPQTEKAPHPRTGSEYEQPNRLAARAQRHYEQARAPILAAFRIAHHRPRAITNLAFFTRFRLDDHPLFRRYCSTQLAYESLNTLIAACKPAPSTKSCQMPIALQPRDGSNSIISRCASLATDGRLPPCSGKVTSGKKSVITSLAGFEVITYGRFWVIADG